MIDVRPSLNTGPSIFGAMSSLFELFTGRTIVYDSGNSRRDFVEDTYSTERLSERLVPWFIGDGHWKRDSCPMERIRRSG